MRVLCCQTRQTNGNWKDSIWARPAGTVYTTRRIWTGGMVWLGQPLQVLVISFNLFLLVRNKQLTFPTMQQFFDTEVLHKNSFRKSIADICIAVLVAPQVSFLWVKGFRFACTCIGSTGNVRESNLEFALGRLQLQRWKQRRILHSWLGHLQLCNCPVHALALRSTASRNRTFRNAGRWRWRLEIRWEGKVKTFENLFSTR